VAFNINPANSGHIKYNNNVDFPTNQYYIYVPSKMNCTAEPNKGFQFNRWIENSGGKSNQTVNTSAISDLIMIDAFIAHAFFMNILLFYLYALLELHFQLVI
jgi:hypothetical protein